MGIRSTPRRVRAPMWLREEIRQWRGADDALRLEIRALAEARQAG